jgi:hypothetical protein
MRNLILPMPSRLLIFIALLWLLGVALIADVRVVALVLLVPGLAVLALCARHVRKGDFDSVAAWAACSLAPLAFLAVIALGRVHLHEFTGRGSACDYMAEDCGPQLAQGIVHVLPLSMLVLAGIATLGLIALARRRADEPA